MARTERIKWRDFWPRVEACGLPWREKAGNCERLLCPPGQPTVCVAGHGTNVIVNPKAMKLLKEWEHKHLIEQNRKWQREREVQSAGLSALREVAGGLDRVVGITGPARRFTLPSAPPAVKASAGVAPDGSDGMDRRERSPRRRLWAAIRRLRCGTR